jgi:hypothetical protein
MMPKRIANGKNRFLEGRVITEENEKFQEEKDGREREIKRIKNNS